MWLACLPAAAASVAPAGHLWLELAEATDAPLPQPVKVLLQRLERATV